MDLGLKSLGNLAHIPLSILHPGVAAQSLSCVQLFVTPWTAERQASVSFNISQSLLKLVSMESVMPSNHLLLCRPFSSCLQSFAPWYLLQTAPICSPHPQSILLSLKEQMTS